MEEAIAAFGQNYWLIFLSSLLLAPEAVLFVTAAMADQPLLTVFLIILVVSIGGSIGSVCIYFLSMLLGRERLFYLAQRAQRYYLIKVDDLEQVFNFFERKGHWVVFFGRMAPTIRSLVSVPPGIIRMPFRRFLVYTFMGTFVWNVFVGYAFYFFWMHAEAINKLLGVYAALCLGAAILFVFWLVGRNIVKKMMDS